jgi:hypothetical protein
MRAHFRQKLAMVFVIILAATAARAETFAKIPPGTSLQVRMVEKLSSETATVGQKFHGNLVAPVVANGRTVFPRGAAVTGEVVNVERSGRLSNPGELHLRLRTIRSGQRIYAVNVPPIVIKGESHAKSNVAKIGGTTAFGAIIGALAGGGKGAAIGAGVGAAAGTGAAAATGKKAAEVPSEAVLVWVAQSAPVQAMPVQAAPPPPPPPPQPQASYYPEEDDERQEMRRDRHEEDRDEDGDYDRGGPEAFSTYDRRIISQCFVDDRAGLPPGLAKRDRLPPGLERHLERNGTLPPGLQRRVQPLPDQCVARLPQLPMNWSRVVLGGRIMLLDPNQRIVDLFWLQGD